MTALRIGCIAFGSGEPCCTGKIIKVDPHRATIGGKSTYGCVNMSDFLEKLVEKLDPNPTSLRNFKRMYSEPTLKKAEPKGPLETAVLYDRAQVLAQTSPCTLHTHVQHPDWDPKLVMLKKHPLQWPPHGRPEASCKTAKPLRQSRRLHSLLSCSVKIPSSLTFDAVSFRQNCSSLPHCMGLSMGMSLISRANKQSPKHHYRVHFDMFGFRCLHQDSPNHRWHRSHRLIITNSFTYNKSAA